MIHVTTIHDQIVSLQIGRRPRYEIHDRLGDLFRVAIAAHRNFGEALRFELRVELEPLDIRTNKIGDRPRFCYANS